MSLKCLKPRLLPQAPTGSGWAKARRMGWTQEQIDDPINLGGKKSLGIFVFQDHVAPHSQGMSLFRKESKWQARRE